jgi:hypothetical protein
MYTLKEIEGSKNRQLNKDEMGCKCPYSFAGICTERCALFEVNTKSGALGGTEPQTTVTLHCTGRQITIEETK